MIEDHRPTGEHEMHERQVDSVQLALIGQQLAAIANDVKSIKDVLEDDRTTPGLITRVDRMEQSIGRQKWFHGLWFSATIGVVMAWVSSKLGIHS